MQDRAPYGVSRHAREVTVNVAATSRYGRISRRCIYKWLSRYEEGEGDPRDGSSASLGAQPRPSATSSPQSPTYARTSESGQASSTRSSRVSATLEN